MSVAKFDKVQPATTGNLVFDGATAPIRDDTFTLTGKTGSAICSAGASQVVTEALCVATSKILVTQYNPGLSAACTKAYAEAGSGQFTLKPLTGNFTGGETYDYTFIQ